MIRLKRGECAVLPLVLMGRWYDMIASGEKREEYRLDTPYWRTRLLNWETALVHWVVAFSRGYRKADMWFMVDALHYPGAPLRNTSRPEWGEPDAPHFVISLGERVELEGGR